MNMMSPEESDDLRTVKALPLWQAFLAAIVAPIVVAIVFGILGSARNAFLLQLEILIIAIAFCLTGILARSKLLGLLSVIAAPISWVILFFIDTLSNNMIPNPFGLLSALAGPLGSITQTGLIPAESAAMMDQVVQGAMIADLFILELMALFFGFFLSMLATGFWTKKGKFSIISVISKPIAAIFVILLILLIPFTYHGIANLVDGSISLVAGGAEFMGIFGGSLDGGLGAQNGGIPIDLSDPEVLQELMLSAQRATEWFRRSQYKFDQVQGNFYTTILTSILAEYIFPEGTYGGIDLKKLPILLDISEVLADVSSEIPYLLLGYFSLVDGFNRTFSVLGTSDLGGGSGGSISAPSADYNPNFNVGLGNLSDAIDYFQESRDGVVSAISGARDIVAEVIVDTSGEMAFILEIIDQVDVGYGIILDIATGAIDFLNATYKTTLAVEDLGDSDFIGSHSWIVSAAIDLIDANTTLNAINSTGLDPNSPLPFWGTVEILKDMTNLLSWFSLAAANGTECYTKMEDVLITLDTLEFNGSDLISLSEGLGALSADLSEVSTLFNAAAGNIVHATDFSETLTTKSYGEIIDGSLRPMLNEFSSMLSTFSQNITQIGGLISGLGYTVSSISALTEGFSLFNQSYTTSYAAASNATDFVNFLLNDPDYNKSKDYMNFCIANASAGWFAIDGADNIDSQAKTNWKNMLYTPNPLFELEPDPEGGSIGGLAQGILNTMASLEAILDLLDAPGFQEIIQTFFEDMDGVPLTDIFSGGSPP